jgi:hypothetical protein
MARRKGYRSVHHFLMEHEGPDYIEEEEEEAPKRILRKEIKKEVRDEDSEEVDVKPQRSGLVYHDLIMLIEKYLLSFLHFSSLSFPLERERRHLLLQVLLTKRMCPTWRKENSRKRERPSRQKKKWKRSSFVF